MADKPENPFKFWEELKRRKVVRVIIGYLASSYVILELISIIAEPFRLPEWTIRFVFILLCIGFVITLILSWIYDFTSEGIKKTESAKAVKQNETVLKAAKWSLKFSDAIIGVLLVLVVILAYPKVIKKDTFKDIRDEDGRISVAVMPFNNLTGDTLHSGLELGLQNLLITRLSNSNDLAVRQMQTMGEILGNTRLLGTASITPEIARDIALKLDANTVILGSIHEYGSNLRITVNFLDSRRAEIYKSFELDTGLENDSFIIIDSLAYLIKNHLEIKVLEQGMNQETRIFAVTGSSEAYRYFSIGLNKFFNMEFDLALDLFEASLKIDPDFFDAAMFLIPTYVVVGRNPEASQLTDYYYKKIDHYTYSQQIMIKYYKNSFDKKPLEAIKYAKLRLEEDPMLRTLWYTLGSDYLKIQQYRNASEAFEKALEIDKSWGGGWVWPLMYVDAGRAYHETGQHDMEKEIYEIGLDVLPDNSWIVFRQAVCALTEGDTLNARIYLDQYRSIGEKENWGDYWINSFTAFIYKEAKQFNKAVEIYRAVIEKYPMEPWSMWQLGFILIDEEINIDEGVKRIDKVLETNSIDGALLVDLYHTKGWGLYKQGKLKIAIDLLKSTWEMRLTYHHNHFLNIQEVEQAIAKQRN